MNIFGIGNMELVVILLVALLVLGPARMVDMARSIGRFWGEAQRTIRFAIDSATVDEEKKPEAAEVQGPVPGPEDAVARPQPHQAGTAQDSADGGPAESRPNGHVPVASSESLSSEDDQRRG